MVSVIIDFLEHFFVSSNTVNYQRIYLDLCRGFETDFYRSCSDDSFPDGTAKIDLNDVGQLKSLDLLDKKSVSVLKMVRRQLIFCEKTTQDKDSNEVKRETGAKSPAENGDVLSPFRSEKFDESETADAAEKP